MKPAAAKKGKAMTREERIQDVMIAMRDACYQPLGEHLLRRLAIIALDAADSTREPCDCRQCHLDRLAHGGGL
jgi:hypothetical protein